MMRWKTVLFNIAFALNCLLFFLILLEQQLQVPLWLQVAGRMHPLVLHFPIVLLVLTIFWELLPHSEQTGAAAKTYIGDVLLLSTSLSAAITSLLGLFLSREEGYAPDVLLWHKWGGVALSLLTLVWYMLRRQVRQAKPLLVVITGAGLVAILVTGHQGANITHGDNFLLAPMMAGTGQPAILLDDAVVFTHMVQPILETKCTGCHNEQKAKGNLVMTTQAALLKGGKTGPLWDRNEQDFGLMFRRVHLPLENKKHMPPKGKPQLTDEELAIIYHWVKRGADFSAKVADLPATDTLRILAGFLFQTIETDQYSFAAADETKIKSLNTSYRVISPLAAASPALGVEFFSAANFNAKHLKELLPIKEQVVSLNLSKMPITDADLKLVGQFKNLRKLNLSFTPISGAGLGALKDLTQLKQLSLSGTQVEWNEVAPLAALPKLSRLFLWNTPIGSAGIQQAAARYPQLKMEGGYTGDTVVLKLNPPLLQNEAQIISEPVPLQLKHYIKGTTIRYTTDGSIPDSLHAPIFTSGAMINQSMTIKAKAFKQGWISSDVVERSFYKAGYKPDSVLLVHPPNEQYKGDGGRTLFDAQKGDQNFRSGKWLGFKEQPLTAQLLFKQPVTLSSVAVSTLVDIGSYIMPPQQLEVWGGNHPSKLRLLGRLRPQQPLKDTSGYMQGYEVLFDATPVSVIKLVAVPVGKLPAWHRGKGDKGWVFVDEVFLNR
ncbi:FN3 associated domain-containing protein [Paracnuella aquatica]|uniref:FN3 associated domain-containing protein n=1 Tax=Paracnuella aquatica TaxID=2268757 RepID=UPI000DEEC1C9|nr:FN3 associated domain-containing protein [Paracnuella aquatica]RPD46503.1 hypothetical protein DRJ53_13765 [Paracnuella aquatica]